jgi:hypothetical protein
MITRDAYDTVTGFDENLPSLEDWDMWLRIAKKFEVGVVPDPLVLYKRINR